jgi:hypothetical protein
MLKPVIAGVLYNLDEYTLDCALLILAWLRFASVSERRTVEEDDQMLQPLGEEKSFTFY